MMWTGGWRRPHSYGDPAAEVRAVHDSVGVIDVSTLGKLLVEGPEAAAFLERLYPNRFGDLKHGRVRYAVLNTDGGRIMDDGTVARLADESFYVTTTSTGAEAVVEWFEWWNAVWRLDVEITDVTGALAAVNIAGPRARELMQRLTDLDVSSDAFTYLDAKQAEIAGVPALVLRIGFVGELGYEIHCANAHAWYLWEAIVAAGSAVGLKPFGVEAQRILRLEKGHLIVGQDTDGLTRGFSAGLDWAIKLDKDDFVGKPELAWQAGGGTGPQLVGLQPVDGTVVPDEASLIMEGDQIAGRVTSSRMSPTLGRAVCLALLDAPLAVAGTEVAVRLPSGRLIRAQVMPQLAHVDPDGRRLRA